MELTNIYYLAAPLTNTIQSEINWTKVEAIAASISDILVFFTLIATIHFAWRGLRAEKTKFAYEKK